MLDSRNVQSQLLGFPTMQNPHHRQAYILLKLSENVTSNAAEEILPNWHRRRLREGDCIIPPVAA